MVQELHPDAKGGASNMRILIAYDGSSYADVAIADLSRAGLPAKADALVVCVADDNALPTLGEVGLADADYPSTFRAKLAEAERLNARACNQIRMLFPAWTVSSEALWGSPAPIILKAVARWLPDLLVTGSHGRSAMARAFLGSVSLKLLHDAPCSVRVVRRTASSTAPVRILIGNDGSPQAAGVIEEVAKRFWPAGTEVRVMSIVETLSPAFVGSLGANMFDTESAFGVIKEEEDDLNHARLQMSARDSANLLRSRGLLVSTDVIDGDPRHELIAEADRWNASTLFVGDRGLGPIERVLLGSVSTAAVTHSHCTVEVVRQSR
jgi:nucleotide-binding universal stress UspA family protein